MLRVLLIQLVNVSAVTTELSAARTGAVTENA